MAQWNKNTVPTCQKKDCSDEVLVTVEKVGSKGQVYRRVLRAVYIPDHHCTLEDMGWSMADETVDWDYSEEDDSYWIPQGWYEVCDYFEDYSYSEITDRVTAWMKLPKAYEPNVKQFGREGYLATDEVKLTQDSVNGIKLPRTPRPEMEKERWM